MLNLHYILLAIIVIIAVDCRERHISLNRLSHRNSLLSTSTTTTTTTTTMPTTTTSTTTEPSINRISKKNPYHLAYGQDYYWRMLGNKKHITDTPNSLVHLDPKDSLKNRIANKGCTDRFACVSCPNAREQMCCYKNIIDKNNIVSSRGICMCLENLDKDHCD